MTAAGVNRSRQAERQADRQAERQVERWTTPKPAQAQAQTHLADRRALAPGEGGT